MPAPLSDLFGPRLLRLGLTGIAVDVRDRRRNPPARFRAGEITFRPDEAWREKMPPRGRRLVTAMCLPFIVGYGWYPRRPARS
jgi:hypothetical protein